MNTVDLTILLFYFSANKKTIEVGRIRSLWLTISIDQLSGRNGWDNKRP